MVRGEVGDGGDAAQKFTRRLDTGHQQIGIVQPVLVTRCVIHKATFVHHFHQAACEGTARIAEEEGHRDMSVAGRIDELQHHRSELHAARDAFELRHAPGVGEREELRGEHGGRLRGDIDVLAEAVALACSEGNQRARCGFGGAMQEGLRHHDAGRWAIIIAGDLQNAGGRQYGQVVGRPARLRTVLSKRGDRHHDQAGVERT